MLGGGLGVRLLAAAATAPPGKYPLPFSSSSLRRRSSSWWFANTGNARERDGATATTSSRAARRRWWSDPDANQQDYGYYGSSSSLEEEEEEEGDDYGDKEEPVFPGLGGAGELFDEPWFSRVYRRYGFLLPVVLASMLAATGPKAFLMAMAIPLGQSAVSFLLDAVWGRRRSNRDGSWRRTFQEEEEEDYPGDTDFGAGSRGKGYSSSSSYEGRRRDSYQSWVSNDFADTASAGGGTDDNSAKSSSSGDGGGSKSGGGFGGWDEILDDNIAAAQDATRSRSSFSASKSDYSKRSPASTAWEGDADATASTGGRMGQGVGVPRTRMRTRRQRAPRTMGLGTTRYKQAPLLMRLLVAVFPFLGSWFRLL